MRLRSTLALTALAVGIAGPSPAAAGYVVIVNASHEGNTISRATLSDIFLQKAIRWGDGSDVHVVDQSLKSDVRTVFSNDALGLTPLAVMNHWHQELRAGRSRRPPRVKETDAEVMEYVASTPGAIGYVSAGAHLSAGVKPLDLAD